MPGLGLCERRRYLFSRQLKRAELLLKFFLYQKPLKLNVDELVKSPFNVTPAQAGIQPDQPRLPEPGPDDDGAGVL
jgi:hypothetical protein